MTQLTLVAPILGIQLILLLLRVENQLQTVAYEIINNFGRSGRN